MQRIVLRPLIGQCSKQLEFGLSMGPITLVILIHCIYFLLHLQLQNMLLFLSLLCELMQGRHLLQIPYPCIE
jgi:hypothetical protein